VLSRQIAGMLRTVVSNSVAVNHPETMAHLHCPPLPGSLAAEVVISSLNQSMDSFDQAPIATVAEQKMIPWLSAEAGLPPLPTERSLRFPQALSLCAHWLAAHGRQLRLLPGIESPDDIDHLLEPRTLQQAAGDHAAISPLAMHRDGRIVIHLGW
jgi:hypothetical protein